MVVLAGWNNDFGASAISSFLGAAKFPNKLPPWAYGFGTYDLLSSFFTVASSLAALFLPKRASFVFGVSGCYASGGLINDSFGLDGGAVLCSL